MATKSAENLSPILIDPAEFRGATLLQEEPGLMYFFGNDGRDYPFSFTNNASSLIAYECCPPLTSIINRKAQAYINGKTWVLNSKGKVATGLIANNLNKLLLNPNPIQNWDDFEAQGYIYQQIFGFNLILMIKPAGFKENIDATAMWNIPPNMLDIKLTRKLFYQTDLAGIIDSIFIEYDGLRTQLPIEDLFFMKDVTTSLRNMILPDSRIKSNRIYVSNIIGALESRGELINYRGARGIFSNKGKDAMGGVAPLKDDQKKRLHSDFKRYGLRQGQRQFILTSANLEWQKIGSDVKDMMLFEEVEDSIMGLCDGWNYPFRLLSSNKSNSLSGTDLLEFKKSLYQDSVMPDACMNYKQWNALFNTSAYNLKIDKDFSHIPALQQDKKIESEGRRLLDQALLLEWRNGMITLNMWLQKNNEDPMTSADGRGDLYFPEYVAKYGDPMKGITYNDNVNLPPINPPADATQTV